MLATNYSMQVATNNLCLTLLILEHILMFQVVIIEDIFLRFMEPQWILNKTTKDFYSLELCFKQFLFLIWLMLVDC